MGKSELEEETKDIRETVRSVKIIKAQRRLK